MNQKIIQPDKSLRNLGDPAYINWRPGDKFIVLDGDFSAEDLLWLASYMQKEV